MKEQKFPLKKKKTGQTGLTIAAYFAVYSFGQSSAKMTMP